MISLLWIVPPLIMWFLFGALMATTPSPTTATKPTTVRSAPAVPASPSQRASTAAERVVTALARRGLTCTGPQGLVEPIQCQKGSVRVPVYGTQPKELVNITLNDPDGGEVIDGSGVFI